MTPEPPPEKLLQEARIIAHLMGKTVYLYNRTGNWQIGEGLQEIPGCACIQLIKPDTGDNKTMISPI